MELRHATCGHWIDAGIPPVGYETERPQYPVWLCGDCKRKATDVAFQFDRKDVVEEVMARRHGSDGKFIKSRED